MCFNRYLKWVALNSFTTSIQTVISTNSMLTSIIKTPSYTDVIATTYIGKDIIGQLFGLCYSLSTSKKADIVPKKYIIKGSILGQIAFLLDNISPLIKNSFYILPILGLSSALKNISFISIGAVNVSTLQKISKNNIGESYSKVASINTISSTLGMITGICIIHIIPSLTIRTFFITPILGIISVYSLSRSVQL